MLDTGSGSSGEGGVPFSPAARRLLTRARSESQRLRHEYVGTEHLVLALVRHPGDEDAQLVARLGLDPDRVRTVMEESIRPGKTEIAADLELPYTSRTKKAISLAAESARAAGHTGVGVEHLVVGLLRERLNIGAEVLQRCGLTEARAAAEVQGIDPGGGAA